jgi:hypothetical protein
VLAVTTCGWDGKVVSSHFEEYEVPVMAVSPPPVVRLL